MLSNWIEGDPFRDMTSLRSMMDRLMEQAVVRPGSFLSAAQNTATPPMNIWEHDNQYLVQVYLPGVRPEDVELNVRQSTLTIKGHWPQPGLGTDTKGASWLLQEFGGGEFSRTLTFPKQVAADHVEAHYDRGVLTITLPLAPHEQPRTISIKESGSQTVIGASEKQQSELAGAGSR